MLRETALFDTLYSELAIGERYGKTCAQVTLRWLLQQPNVILIPKDSRTDHFQENLEVFDYELTAEEMDAVFTVEDGLVDHLRGLFWW